MGDLDKEYHEVIDQIKKKNAEKVELSDYIPTLGKAWCSIDWTNKLRRPLKVQHNHPAAACEEDNVQHQR